MKKKNFLGFTLFKGGGVPEQKCEISHLFFFLSEPFPKTQDSTLDTPQGGVLDNFFLPISVSAGKLQGACAE